MKRIMACFALAAVLIAAGCSTTTTEVRTKTTRATGSETIVE